jgi:hypothetical protein
MRINIIQPADWVAAFRRAAQRENLSLSEWLGRVAKEALPAKEAATLGERPKVGKRAKAKE